MIATELHRSCVLVGSPATQGLTRYLVSKDTKVYRLALVWTLAEIACSAQSLFASAQSLTLVWSGLQLIKVALLLDWRVTVLTSFAGWSLGLLWWYEISRFRLGRGVVVKLVISLTLKGEINNITLNNTLCCHYTTVYRLATVDSEISVTSNTKQQWCQPISVWV